MEFFIPLSNINSRPKKRYPSLFQKMQIPCFFRYQARCSLRVVGPDAAEFLQGQFSNDLSTIGVGELAYGLWLDRKGKIVADSFVLREREEAFLALSYYCSESAVQERLDAYLIMEEAELVRSSAPVNAVCIFGKSAQQKICSVLAIELPAQGRFAACSGVIAFWGRRGGEAALEIVFEGLDANACIDKIDACLEEVGAAELSSADVAFSTIEAKVPRLGLDFGTSDLPQELGLETDAVSFNKGCYLGQEVMARLRAMGRVRKKLARVRIDKPITSDVLELPLDLMDVQGKRQGQLRALAYSDSGGFGLAVVSTGFGGQFLVNGSLQVELLEERDQSDG